MPPQLLKRLNRAIELGGDGASLRFDLASALEQQGHWKKRSLICGMRLC